MVTVRENNIWAIGHDGPLYLVILLPKALFNF